jgi:hypothetical protein
MTPENKMFIAMKMMQEVCKETENQDDFCERCPFYHLCTSLVYVCGEPNPSKWWI